MGKKIIEGSLAIDAHLHKDWFEVSKLTIGTIIMCPEGCKRLLTPVAGIYDFDKEKQKWLNDNGKEFIFPNDF